MSFLFGKKKPGSREVAPTNPPANAVREKDKPSGAGAQTTPGSSVNNSLNSLGGASPDHGRTRLDQENQQFGPRAGGGPVGPPNGVPNANLYPWSQRQLTFTSNQPNPFPRYGAAVNATASKEGDIYVMGGLVNGSTVKGDLWMIEAGDGTLACFPIRTEAEGPGPRVGHASLLVGNAFIVFGGDTKQDENDPLDDTLYLLNTSSKQWSRALPPGIRPAGRYGHTLNILGSKLYIFGGQVDGHFFNDLVAFDLNQLQNPANRWEMLVPDSIDETSLGRQVPLGRTNHTVIAWNEKLYLFGGTDGQQWFNDVWTYDPRTNLWSQLDCIGYIPQPREGHSAALVNDVMYIFGGRTQEGDDLGDLAAFRITSRRWYTFQNMGPSPSPRSGHSMTAYDKQIVVLAGEPSSTQRDPSELSIAYVLDTAKIRYPNDQQIQQTPTGERVAGNRRPSTDRPPGVGRGAPRDGPPMTNGPPGIVPGSRLPRAASGSQPTPGPPPQQQAPAPRTAGSGIPTPTGPRSRTPTRDPRGYGAPQDMSRGPSFERPENRQDVPVGTFEAQRGPPGRPMSPATAPRGPTVLQPSKLGPSFAENQGVPIDFSARSQPQVQPQVQPQAQQQAAQPEVQLQAQPQAQPPRQHGSIDETERNQAQNNASQQNVPLRQRGESDADQTARDDSTIARDTTSSKQMDAMVKELDDLKRSNAWYMSELALASKAGYGSGTTHRSSLDGTAKSLGEDDKPLVEALIAMKAELTEVQGSFASRVEEAAKKVSQAEQQRDAAVREAVYAKAKLAAHGGTPNGSPQLDDSLRDPDSSDRNADIVHKLGTALALQNELQTKLSNLTTEHAAEKQAREVAENNADAAQKRALELDQTRNPAELESLRAELHEAQKVAREESAQRTDAQARANLLEIDNEELKQQLEESTAHSTDHSTMLVSLREAVNASQDKYSLMENKLQEEREGREVVQRKLVQLMTEHEERTAELEATTKKLRDAEELAEKHANEAQAHRNVMMSGLEKLNAREINDSQGALTDRRVEILQQQVNDANSLVTKSQAEAEAASDKLRRAEERIAGLESYQQQASREGLGIRKQLQEAIRTAQTFQSQHAELRQQLESHRRDASALAVQHGALKDLLDERSSSAARNLDSPSSSQLNSTDMSRLRELEQLLEDSRKAHHETKSSFEAREQESEKAYREKLEQLEQDYQSAVSYVKGTEKMLKRMKDELTKSKAQNSRIQTDLEKAQRSGGESEAPSGWEAERHALRREIEEMQESVKGSVFQLERQMDHVRAELQSAQAERDQLRGRYEQLNQLSQQAQADLEQMRSENAALESRAMDAENKVSLLLDQVESSVDNYRRQSQSMHMNGTSHTRDTSTTSTYTAGGGHSHSNSIGGESNFSTGGGAAERNSMALDNLASELETLRTQWEGTHRTYRLSNNFDFERSPSNGTGGELSNSLASWRKRLDAEERDKETGRLPGESSAAAPGALRVGGQRGPEPDGGQLRRTGTGESPNAMNVI